MSMKYKSIPSKRGDPGTRYPKPLILQIVREVENGLPRKDACDKYEMAYCTLGEWMSKFGSAAYHATKRASYPIHLRRTIVRALQEGRMTKDEAHLIHKVDKKILTTWLRKAKHWDNELASFNQEDMASKKNSYSGNEFQKELADARLKIKALETMIDIAEEQFKIPIRKKSGAKQ